MSAPTTAPAGWYADPDDAGLLRYWTGTKWTEDRQPSVAPPGAVQVAPLQASVPGRGLGIAGFVLALLGPWTAWLGAILGAVGGTISKKAGHKNGWATAAVWIFIGELAIVILIAVINALQYR